MYAVMVNLLLLINAYNELDIDRDWKQPLRFNQNCKAIGETLI